MTSSYQLIQLVSFSTVILTVWRGLASIYLERGQWLAFLATTPNYLEGAMSKKREHTEVRITSFGSGKRWRFVQTKYGTVYCVDQLLFQGGELKKVDSHRFDEDGTKFTVQLRPIEIQDLSEISEFLKQPLR